MRLRGSALGLTIAALGASYAPAALAADPDTGFFIVGAVGLQHQSIDYAGQVESAYSGTQFVITNATATDSHGPSYTIYAGYQFHPSFGVEIGYSDLGKAKTSYTLSRLGTFIHNGEHSIQAARASVYVLLPMTESWSLIAKAGAARTSLKYSETGTSLGQPTSFTSPAVNQARFVTGFGTKYAFNRRMAVRLDWEVYFGVGRTFNQGTEENGKFDSISAVNVGFEYRF